MIISFVKLDGDDDDDDECFICMYCILYIKLSILGCFHLSYTVSGTVVKMSMGVYFES